MQRCARNSARLVFTGGMHRSIPQYKSLSAVTAIKGQYTKAIDQIAFVVFTPSGLFSGLESHTKLNEFRTEDKGKLLKPFSQLSSYNLPISDANPEIVVLKGRIREHKVRKPVVLMFSLCSFDLGLRQLPLISVFMISV